MFYPFLPVFARGLGVDLAVVSRALALRSAAGFLGPFLASFTDAYDRRLGMALGLGLCATGMGLIGLWPGFLSFAIGLTLGALGNILFVTAMQAYLGERIPYQRRGLIVALTELSWSGSFFIGVPLVGLLIASYSWQTPFPILAGLCLIMLAMLAIFLPKSPSQTPGKTTAWRSLWSVFSWPPALAGLLVGASMSCSNELISVTFGVWIEDNFSVQIAALAIASVVIGLSELLGEGFSGGFTDRLGKGRAVQFGLMLNTLGLLALPWLGSSLPGALAGLFLIYMTFEFSVVSVIPLMTELLPSARATLMASYIASTAIGRAIGALISPGLYRFQAWGWPGIYWIVLGAILVNLLALTALRKLRMSEPNLSPFAGQGS